MKKRKNQSGQMTVEAVLIVTLLLSITMAVSQKLQNEGYLAKLVNGPWTYLAGMMENGIWAPPEAGRGSHPNHILRHGSPEGDRP